MKQGTITNHSTYISIQPFEDYTSEKSFHPLLKKLSMWDKVSHQYTFHMYDFNEETKELRIPAGIPRDLLIKYLVTNPSNTVEYEFCNDIRIPRNFSPRYSMLVEPRSNIQVRALDFLRQQNLPQRFLSLDTGDGKTFCVVSYAVRTGQIPAIFVSSLKLLEQWKEKILQYTDIPEDEILLVADGNIDKIDFTKNYQFLLFSHRTVGRYLDIEEDHDLEALLNKLHYTMKVFDEAHLDMESIVRIDRETSLSSLYVTATPLRSNRDEDLLYQRIYQTVPKFTSRNNSIEDQTEKYHNVVIVKFNSKPSMEFQIDFQKKSSRRGFNVPVYTNYIMEEDNFSQYVNIIYQILYNLILNKGSARRKTVILVKNIKLLDELLEQTKKNLAKDSLGEAYKLTRFHSKVPTTEKEVALDGDIIFSTDSSLSTAIDIAKLQAVISLIPTSSETLTSQMLGRLRNNGEPVYYFDLVDTGFDDCKKQLTRRKSKVYSRKAKTLREITL